MKHSGSRLLDRNPAPLREAQGANRRINAELDAKSLRKAPCADAHFERRPKIILPEHADSGELVLKENTPV